MSEPNKQDPAAAGAAGGDAGKEPKVDSQKPAAETKGGTADPPKADPPKTPSKKKEDDGDTNLDELDQRFDISKDALEKRLKRAGSKALKDAFGTDDVESIKKTIEEHKNLKKADEEAKRAALSEKEQLEGDLRTAKDENAALQQKLEAMEEAATEAAQERAIRAVAEEYADPKYVRVAMSDFADHVEKMSDKDAEKFGPDDAKTWFEQWAKDNEKLAKAAVTDDKKEPEKPKAGVTTGRQGNAPAQQPSGSQGKKVKDMSKTELREHAAKFGIRPGTL